MKPSRRYFAMLIAMVMSQAIQAQDLYPGTCTTPLPYFDDFENGYVILRDGTRIDGELSIKNYEKDGRISITTKDKKKYKFDVRSLDTWGLDINIPVNYSPLSYYEWRNQKRKENKEPERGFVILTSGETKQGRIKIEGRSSDSPLAAENYFAIETLTFVGKDGTATEYTREQIKGFGRVLPWALSPDELFQWQRGEAMGRRKTKHAPGYVIMNDGRKIEGDMQLVVKNKLPRNKSSGSDDFMFGEQPENLDKTRSDIVDEIHFSREGRDEKIELDDVFAYGLAGVTINKLTNNGDRSYLMEEMNFHAGTVTTVDGQTRKGFLAYFPAPDNYYGVYFATSKDEPVIAIQMKDIKDAHQEISLIEAFGEEDMKKENRNINGYIIALDGSKFDGTVKLVDDNEWWVASIEFTDRDGNMLSYGGDNDAIAYCVVDGTMYVQHESVFVKTDRMAAPLALYTNPYPDNSTALGRFAMAQASNLVASAAASAATTATWGAQAAHGIKAKGVSINGKKSEGLDFGGNVGTAVGDGVLQMLSKSARKKGQLPSKAKRGEQLMVVNTYTGEIVPSSFSKLELMLEGCMKYLDLDSKSQKAMLKSGNAPLVDYLNQCYSNFGIN